MSKGDITIGGKCDLKINDVVAEMSTRIDDEICNTWKIKREDVNKALQAQQRIDKAIEYVNKQIKDDHYCRKSSDLINSLLSILQD